MKIVQTPSLSNKVATGVDIVATLAVEQMGYMLSIPAWHPIMLGTVVGMTYVLFKYKDEVTSVFIDTLAPFQNKNSYSFTTTEPSVVYNRKKREFKETMKRSKSRVNPILVVESCAAV